MSNFRINFQLQELDKICPWGEEPHLSLNWFGLTDGLLWINAGSQTIYEYSEEAQKYFSGSPRYNDYNICRFLEDFSDTFRYVSESIPEVLFNSIEKFDLNTDIWKNIHTNDDEEIFNKFYFDEYCELIQWYCDRSLDSSHLVGGPHIGCFRCKDKIKILWNSDFTLDNGSSIWTSPNGIFEMPYVEFAASVTDFFDSFFNAMDKQVTMAVSKDWGNIELDKERLISENAKRKTVFYQNTALLTNPQKNTDWDNVMKIYQNMKDELNTNS